MNLKEGDNMSKIVTDDVLKELIAKLKTLINSKASADDLDAKADAVHTHAIADVTNLQTTLNNKAEATHTHTFDDIPNLETSLSGKATVSYVQTQVGTKADAVHTHAIADVTNLQTTLNNKADATHTHDWDDIPNLEASLSGKATVSYVNDKLALKADATDVLQPTIINATIPVYSPATDDTYTQHPLTVEGILETDSPIVSPIITTASGGAEAKAILEAWNTIAGIVTYDGRIAVITIGADVPTVEIPIQMLVYR